MKTALLTVQTNETQGQGLTQLSGSELGLWLAAIYRSLSFALITNLQHQTAAGFVCEHLKRENKCNPDKNERMLSF